MSDKNSEIDKKQIKKKLEQKHNVNVELESIFIKDKVLYFSYNMDSIDAEFGWQIGMDSLESLENFEMFS